MSGSVGGGETAEPNLVPILDMVFQLITFFMLVMNFKSAAMDLNLRLPVVGSAQPVDEKASDAQSLVLNIDSQGALKVAGQAITNIGGFVANEGKIAQAAAKRASSSFKPGDDLPMTIVIRADKETKFNMLYRIIKLFQQQGFHQFNYMAVKKVEGA